MFQLLQSHPLSQWEEIFSWHHLNNMAMWGFTDTAASFLWMTWTTSTVSLCIQAIFIKHSRIHYLTHKLWTIFVASSAGFIIGSHLLLPTPSIQKILDVSHDGTEAALSCDLQYRYIMRSNLTSLFGKQNIKTKERSMSYKRSHAI